MGRRAGDAADMSMIELVERTAPAAAEGETPKKGKKAKAEPAEKSA